MKMLQNLELGFFNGQIQVFQFSLGPHTAHGSHFQKLFRPDSGVNVEYGAYLKIIE
jgi:hypothetical protein